MNARRKIDAVRKSLAVVLALALPACVSGLGGVCARAAARPGATLADAEARGAVSQAAAPAPTLVVTSNADTDDGACNAANCTLRAAIKAADAQDGDDVISFAAGVTGTINLLTALPAVSTNIQIAGPGADKLTVQRSGAAGTPNFGVLRITSGTVAVSGLTFSGGSTDTEGGGISNSGTLTLSGCAVTGNKSTRLGGDGIYNEGRLTVNDSTVSGNSSDSGSGGGIFNERFANATVSNSAIANNTAQGGGGIFNAGTFTVSGSTVSGNKDFGTNGGGINNFGSFTITNSTVSGNTSVVGDGAGIANGGSCVVVNSTVSGNSTGSGWGGGINNQSSLSISNSTVANNSADVGGGLFSGGSPINIVNTIVAGNRVRSSLPDVHGTYASQGFNLIGNIGTFATGFGAAGDRVGTPTAPLDPKLGPLAFNGGPTETHALLAGSPAIDQGGCSKATSADQRGVFRYDFPDVANADGGCDIGAFEAQALSLVSVDSANVTEGDAGTTDMTFNVSLDHPSASPVSVDYATEDFTATAGAD